MDVSRRNLILGAGAAALQSAAAPTASLPAKSDFAVVKSETCLNNARWHPISIGATRALQQYLEYKASGGGAAPDYSGELQKRVKAQFAELIHARPAEISYVPSTTVGENLVAAGLDLQHSGGNVVTDALHFEGSLYQYGALAKQGLDVRFVRPRGWRIELSDLEKAIDSKTKLVALSLVSMINGFQYDLKAVCDLAHSRGALVYADAVQAIGLFPSMCERAASTSAPAPVTSGSWATWVSDSFTYARICSTGCIAANTDFVNLRECSITHFLTTRRETPLWIGPRLRTRAVTSRSGRCRTQRWLVFRIR